MWDENKVTKWMSSIGYSSFEKQFRGKIFENFQNRSICI